MQGNAFPRGAVTPSLVLRTLLFLLLPTITFSVGSTLSYADQVTTFVLQGSSSGGVAISGSLTYDFTLGEFTAADIFLNGGQDFPTPVALTGVSGGFPEFSVLGALGAFADFALAASPTPNALLFCTTTYDPSSCDAFSPFGSNLGRGGSTLIDPITSLSATPSPEPSSLILVFSGCLAIGLRIRSRLARA
jgi:hypothetical protein